MNAANLTQLVKRKNIMLTPEELEELEERHTEELYKLRNIAPLFPSPEPVVEPNLTLSEVVDLTCPASSSSPEWRSFLKQCLAHPDIKEIDLMRGQLIHPKESLPIFTCIAELYQAGHTTEEIATTIRKEFPNKGQAAC
jgi:hypothetical protein